MRPSTFQYRAQQNQFEDINLVPSLGGTIIQFQAGLSLNVGDAVQIGGTSTVTKLITTPNRAIGIVVGGQSMPDAGIFESTGNVASDAALITAGILAATVGQFVFVLVQGVFWAVADGAIANGAQIKLSTGTAGRITAAVSALTVAAGATAVTSTAVNGAIISGDDSAGHVIGKLVDVAAAANGDVRLVYVNIH